MHAWQAEKANQARPYVSQLCMQLLAFLQQHSVRPLTHMRPLQERAEEASALASAAAAERAELHAELAAARQALTDAQAASDARVQVLPQVPVCIVRAV